MSTFKKKIRIIEMRWNKINRLACTHTRVCEWERVRTQARVFAYLQIGLYRILSYELGCWPRQSSYPWWYAAEERLLLDGRLGPADPPTPAAPPPLPPLPCLLGSALRLDWPLRELCGFAWCDRLTFRMLPEELSSPEPLDCTLRAPGYLYCPCGCLCLG